MQQRVAWHLRQLDGQCIQTLERGLARCGGMGGGCGDVMAVVVTVGVGGGVVVADMDVVVAVMVVAVGTLLLLV